MWYFTYVSLSTAQSRIQWSIPCVKRCSVIKSKLLHVNRVSKLYLELDSDSERMSITVTFYNNMRSKSMKNIFYKCRNFLRPMQPWPVGKIAISRISWESNSQPRISSLSAPPTRRPLLRTCTTDICNSAVYGLNQIVLWLYGSIPPHHYNT